LAQERILADNLRLSCVMANYLAAYMPVLPACLTSHAACGYVQAAITALSPTAHVPAALVPTALVPAALVPAVERLQSSPATASVAVKVRGSLGEALARQCEQTNSKQRNNSVSLHSGPFVFKWIWKESGPNTWRVPHGLYEPPPLGHII